MPRFDISSLSNLTPARHRLRDFDRVTIFIWTAVILTAVIDLGLTAIGFSQGLTERNYVAARLVQTWGFVSLIAIKAFIITFAAVAWWWAPDPHRIAIPAAVAGPWGIASLTNVFLLL